jgi:hypothetical protein
MSYVFTCRAQCPLSNDKRSFLGCCTARRRLTWSRRLRWRWRLTWSRWLTWSRRLRWRWRLTWHRRLLRRTTRRRMKVQDRGRLAVGQL